MTPCAADISPTLPFWVTSDTHFNHKMMPEYCDRPEDHNEIMVENWWSVVKPKDTIVHLGDLALGTKDDCYTLIGGDNELPGRKFLVKGNHDKWSIAFYESLGFTVIKPFMLVYGEWKIRFQHYPIERMYPKSVVICGHTHNNYVAAHDRHHVNVGVDMRWGRPVSATFHIENAIRRLTYEDRARDYRPAGKDLVGLED